MSHYTKMRTRLTNTDFLVRALSDAASKTNRVLFDPERDGQPAGDEITVRIVRCRSRIIRPQSDLALGFIPSPVA